MLFEISNSIKPYPSVVRAYISKLKPVTSFFELKNLDEASNRLPPTSSEGSPAGDTGISERGARRKSGSEAPAHAASLILGAPDVRRGVGEVERLVTHGFLPSQEKNRASQLETPRFVAFTSA